jgi:hypothetical protein
MGIIECSGKQKGPDDFARPGRSSAGNAEKEAVSAISACSAFLF